jgi:chromosome segregation ATPase
MSRNNGRGINQQYKQALDSKKENLLKIAESYQQWKAEIEDLEVQLKKITDQKQEVQMKNQMIQDDSAAQEKIYKHLMATKHELKFANQDLRMENNRVDPVWEEQKKALGHQIKRMKGLKLEIVEEGVMEQKAFEETHGKLSKSLEQTKREVGLLEEDIKRYKNLIVQLKYKEQREQADIEYETLKFKNFLLDINSQLEEINLSK